MSRLAPLKPDTFALRIFPLLTMMGVMVLIVGLIWGLGLAGVAGSYWNHAIASELDPAQAGSDLLAQFGTLSGSLKWLAALRFLGMAMLFTGITVALTVILRTLQTQEMMLAGFLEAKARRA